MPRRRSNIRKVFPRGKPIFFFIALKGFFLFDEVIKSHSPSEDSFLPEGFGYMELTDSVNIMNQNTDENKSPFEIWTVSSPILGTFQKCIFLLE